MTSDQIREQVHTLVDRWANMAITHGARSLPSVALTRLETAILSTLADQWEEAAKIVKTWAQDNETIQPSFTKIAVKLQAKADAMRGNKT